MNTQINLDVQISLDAESQERLTQEAARRGQGAPTFARDLLRAALDNLPVVKIARQNSSPVCYFHAGW